LQSAANEETSSPLPLPNCSDSSGEGVYWCNHHNREATHEDKRGRCCDPTLGGILIPCQVVFSPMRISDSREN
jgi:hypothetical protein